MAKELMDAVLAVDWNAAKSANAADIHRSVQLLLVNAAGDMKGHYTLVAYPKP